ncbi:AAA family ATPase [soil metagenome]
MTHPDLLVERRYLDHVDTCRDEEIDRLDKLTYAGVDAKANKAQRELTEKRRGVLEDRSRPLGIGRLDLEGSSSPLYVGRCFVKDRSGEAVLVNWKAHVAEPFFQASQANPLDVSRKRAFRFEELKLVDLEDEVFGDRPDEAATPSVQWGPADDALLAELTRGRSAAMRDIVATIQAEQDSLIRAALPGVLLIQGAPGTGKTAVGLHRVSYLLYAHSRLIDDRTVLVVGPNRAFMHYVRHVLPSLGDTAVRQQSIEDLSDTGAAEAVDSEEVARLKGDGRMQYLIAKGIDGLVRPPDTQLRFLRGRLTLEREMARSIVEDIKTRRLPHNTGREHIREQWIRAVHERHPSRQLDDVARVLRNDQDFTNALDRVWPTYTAQTFLYELLSTETRFARAAAGLLTHEERQLLRREPGQRLAGIKWSTHDIALLDEVEHRLRGTPPTYRHVVVDEVHDLSPMQLRMIARRCPSGSMTLLGDLAQGTAPCAPRRWGEVLEHLPTESGWQLSELPRGYRVPQQIMELASHLLPHIDVEVSRAESLRPGEHDPKIVHADPDDLDSSIGREVRYLREPTGWVGVICADEDVDRCRESFRRAEVAFDDIETATQQAGVTLVPASLSKGLEFDNVLVVEPTAIVNQSDHGLRLLYVALTRATQRLVVLHSLALPDELLGDQLDDQSPIGSGGPHAGMITPGWVVEGPGDLATHAFALQVEDSRSDVWRVEFRPREGGMSFALERLTVGDMLLSTDARGWLAWNANDVVAAWRDEKTRRVGHVVLRNAAPPATDPSGTENLRTLQMLGLNLCEAVTNRRAASKG